MPDADPTVAIVVLLLLHVPPPVRSPNGVVFPEHTDSVPVILCGPGFTVTVAVVAQPAVDVYVMIALPPGFAPPVKDPEVDPMVATVVLLLLHVPPDNGSPNGVVDPAHSDKVPVIAPGVGFTVTTVFIVQPVVGAV